MTKKKVYALYRVSTKKQVDCMKQLDGVADKHDIPMQKKACHAFIDSHSDWEFYDEIAELGVSGFKVSAKNRDAIQTIQHAALEKKFDVLLVFMFDRLGRIDDETPFVLEWFVKHGIEVWSVNEGQQRFDQHVDKLTNYIRFWQAAGESEKTSIRTTESLGQMVQQGHFRGGCAPFGYQLEKRGRFNKRNHEVYEIEIHEREAAVVQLIFNLYYTYGYGSQRISTYLTESGIMTRKGDNFTHVTIYHMLKNRAYTGVLKSGKTVSQIFPHLQIISLETFEQVQLLMRERAKPKDERVVPLNTKGNSLLSGLGYCGHCGARLVITTSGKKRVRKDGTEVVTPKIRYVCYNRTRHKHKCDGQTGYTVGKLDKVIDAVMHNLFAHLNDLPKEEIINQRYAEQIGNIQMQLANARVAFQAHSAEVMEYEAEVIKVIRGESSINSELLNKLYEDAKRKAAESEQAVLQLGEKLKSREGMKSTLVKQFDDMKSWADMYDECGIETRKMILSHIIRSVRVKRDYNIEIDLNIACEELGISSCEIGESRLQVAG